MGAFGAIAVILSVAAVPLVGLFANPEAWHYGFYLIGSFSVISGILIFIFFQDPGRGAAEEEVAGIAYTPREVQPIDFVRLLKIPTLTFLFLQKFFNGGLLIWSFGVVYMVDIYAFDNDEAIIIMIVPLLLGNILGNIFGGVLGDRLNQRFPRSGRIALLQSAFFFSAVMSFLATQISWGTTSGFVSTFFFWGIFLSFGTGLDRPMIAAVTPPELRSTAFGVLMSVGDALASLVLVSITGWAGNLFGLQTAFLVLVSGVMFIRSFIWFIAYIPYSRDIDQMKHFMSK
jgi:hypothetical protein